MTPPSVRTRLEIVIAWNKIHQIAERLTRALIGLKVVLEKTKGLDREPRGEEVQIVVDSPATTEIGSACIGLATLPNNLKQHRIIRPLLYLNRLPGAVRQDIGTTHNGKSYLRPSEFLIDRAIDWSLQALRFADSVIETYLNTLTKSPKRNGR